MTGNVWRSLFLLLLTISMVCRGEEPDDEAEDDVPSGFENLDAPRETEIEIWYAGQRRGAVFARFTSQWVSFQQPGLVLSMLPGVRDKEAVGKALQGQLSSHSDLVCRGRSEGEWCGALSLDSLQEQAAAVIFDHRRFRATVFINPDYLFIRSLSHERYLSGASREFSAVQGLSLNLSGARAQDSTDHYSWYGRSVLSLGEKHLFSDWSYDKSEHFSIASLYAERDWQGREIIGGLFGGSSFGLGFSADPQLLGVRVAHSTDSMNGQVAVNNTPIVVYLPVRGRVELYREGKLLKAELLEAGRQQLNTQGLPQGAYNLTVRVYDGTILLDEQRMLYVKSNSLPGKDDPQYFFELGRPVENVQESWWPEAGEGWVMRGGYSQLITPTSSFTLAGTVENSDALAEVGLLNIREYLELSGGVVVARGNRKGFYGNSILHRESWQLQARYRELSKKAEGSPSDLLGGGFRNGQLTLAKSFSSLSVEMGRDWQRDQSQKQTRITDHVHLEWPLLRGKAFDLQLALDASSSQLEGERHSQVLASVTLHHREGSRTTTFQQTRQENRTGAGRDLSLTSRAAARWQRLAIAGQDVSTGVYLDKNRQQETLGGDAHFSGRWLGGQLALNRVLPDEGESVTNYTGSFSTSTLARLDDVMVGGGRLSDSAVLVDLQGDGSGTFDVLVNSQPVAHAKAGVQVPLVLAPFRKYSIAIKARGNNFSDYDDREQSVTLYPGNVARVSFSVTEVTPVLGRLYDESGNPLEGAVLENVQEPVFTDGKGLFQARLRPSLKVLKVQTADGQHCDAKLPEERRLRRGVALLGRLTCTNGVE